MYKYCKRLLHQCFGATCRISTHCDNCTQYSRGYEISRDFIVIAFSLSSGTFGVKSGRSGLEYPVSGTGERVMINRQTARAVYPSRPISIPPSIHPSI